MFRLLTTSLLAILCLHLPAAHGKPAQAEKADAIQIAKIPDIPPAKSEQFDQAFRRGVDFLLKTQNRDGSWGDHRVIGTWNTWAHTYVLDAMSMRAARLDRNSPRYRELKSCAGSQVKKLNELASAMGGWGYLTYSGFSKRPAAQPTSFLTGTVLISAWMAGKSFGLSLDNKIFSRALKFLKSQRTPAGTYVYSLGHAFYPGRPINRHTGSLARTPACDYAIRLWEPEDISLRQLVDGLDRLWSRRGWLTMALHKPTPHESFAQNSGYFFYYGYYYSGMCLDMLAPNQVKRHASLLADDILTRQGTDGSWWDYPLYNYHKFYGTGYALYALSRAWDKLYGQPEPPSSLTSTPFRP